MTSILPNPTLRTEVVSAFAYVLAFGSGTFMNSSSVMARFPFVPVLSVWLFPLFPPT